MCTQSMLKEILDKVVSFSKDVFKDKLVDVILFGKLMWFYSVSYRIVLKILRVIREVSLGKAKNLCLKNETCL